MKLLALKTRCAMALLIAGIRGRSALADKPSWAGNDKGRQERSRRRVTIARVTARTATATRARTMTVVPMATGATSSRSSTWCALLRRALSWALRSPGLAKKHTAACRRDRPRNGGSVTSCRARRDLLRGSRIAGDTDRSSPAGHRYVRVAGDILMLAIGTGLVVDAIADPRRHVGIRLP